MDETREYVVNVQYQTNAGNPANRRLRVNAIDEESAMDAGVERVRKFRNCLKIDGADAQLAAPEAAPSP